MYVSRLQFIEGSKILLNTRLYDRVRGYDGNSI